MRSTTGRTFLPFSEWVSPTPTQSNCSYLHLYLTVFQRGFMGYWSNTYGGTAHFQGSWSNDQCLFEHDETTPEITEIQNTGYSAFRMVGYAKQTGFGGPYKRRVTTGVSYGPGPCFGEGG